MLYEASMVYHVASSVSHRYCRRADIFFNSTGCLHIERVRMAMVNGSFGYRFQQNSSNALGGGQERKSCWPYCIVPRPESKNHLHPSPFYRPLLRFLPV